MDRITPLLMAISPFVYGLIDYIAYSIGGNDATFSRKLLYTSFKYPLVPLFIVYSMGVFCRHCFIPTFSDEVPAVPDVIGRMCLVLSPSFYVIVIVASGDGVVDANKRAILVGGWWGLVGFMLLSFLLGLAAGRFLPQHVSPLQPEITK
jgi:hypothetical protein